MFSLPVKFYYFIIASTDRTLSAHIYKRTHTHAHAHTNRPDKSDLIIALANEHATAYCTAAGLL